VVWTLEARAEARAADLGLPAFQGLLICWLSIYLGTPPLKVCQCCMYRAEWLRGVQRLPHAACIEEDSLAKKHPELGFHADVRKLGPVRYAREHSTSPCCA